VSAAQYERHWSALPAADRSALAATVGHHGGNSPAQMLKALLAQVKQIIIEWELAEAVFKAATLPKFAAITNRALPNCDLLPGDCFGALVSLTFNRGASYSRAPDPQKDPKDRYREMRAIGVAMKARDFAAVPGQIRAMKRIWLGTAVEAEMSRRRDDEAKLFEAGLAVA
jgi:GH24 family phage-related lysozyme (muramidase)